MAASVWLWTRYVVSYLDINNSFSRFLKYMGGGLFFGVVMAIPLNRFWPLMFYFDSSGVYHAGIARDGMFIHQIILLLLTSIYAFFFAPVSSEKKRQRYWTIGFSGLLIMFFVVGQIFFPTYPLYAISYMLGGCLLRTFVIENEREEYHRNLELALEREREQFNELNKAWTLAYKDALTGVKSKLAYAEKIEQIDREIAKGIRQELALVVLDVNNLKRINDTLGHDVGDAYIKEACRLICDSFKKSPVYRVGGDEFVVFLEQEDYENREKLLAAFNAVVEENRQHGAVVVAAGIAEYVPEQDNSCKRIFDRADEAMYKRKHALKIFPSV
jgi:diguanylate cyclase (GGDEF)-like protein